MTEEMRRILVISPSFPPKNTADLHRVRVSLRHYSGFGWDPTVLCVSPECCEGLDDPALAESLPANLRVVRVKAWDEATCRHFGFGHLAYRSAIPLYRAGCKLLRREHFDVVFFSTTVFLTFVLGALWKRRYGCRIVYDFQDPWYADEPIYTPDTVPGRWWKYRLDQFLARFLERYAMRAADHVVAVSDGYVRDLSRRYGWLDRSKFTVLPFGGSYDDYDFVRRHNIEQNLIRPDGRSVNWVYVGRGGSDMAPVLSVLFTALAALQRADPAFALRLCLHFVGTNYAPPERTHKLVEPLARAHGVVSLVHEVSTRIPYFEAISLYAASDAILLIGSVHADYTASKLISCVLSKKPVLALFHRGSLVAKMAAEFPNVFLATFDETPGEPAFEAQVVRGLEWLRAPAFDVCAVEARLAPWSADEMTRRQCVIFDSLVEPAALSATSPVAPSGIAS